MFLRAKTGGATLVQFVCGSVLGFLSGLGSIISSCGNGASECVTNAFVSLLLIIVTVAAYGVVLLVGYTAQERRNKKLAILLIGMELLAAVIFIFDARQSPSAFDKAANVASFLIAVWVGIVAFRQFQAGNTRIVSGRRRHLS